MSTMRVFIAELAILSSFVLVNAVTQDDFTQFYYSKFPQTTSEKESVVSSPYITYKGVAQKLQYRELTRSGNTYGPTGTIMGAARDYRDERIVGPPGATAGHGGEHMISDMVDFASILRSRGSDPRKLWVVVHHEDMPAQTQAVEVMQDADGILKAKEVYDVNFTAHNGVVGTCAGSVSPWNTHLGGEEWGLPTAKEFEAWTSEDDFRTRRDAASLRFHGIDPNTATLAEVRAKFHPYMNMYPHEITVDDSSAGAPKISAVKHYSMGRYKIELPYCLPTSPQVCYIMDDANNGIPCAYVPDTPNDLSAGHLYCAHVSMTVNGTVPSGLGGAGEFSVTWKSLGHATDAEIKKHIDAGTRFSDLFESQDPDPAAVEAGDANSLCSSGFTSVNVGYGPECLKLIGDPVLASRFETRRYAAMVGATAEWTKMEGMTFDPVRNEMYMAMSSLQKSMEDFAKYGSPSNAYDLGGANDVRTKFNPCGCVYRMELNADNFFSSIRPLVCGIPNTMNTGDARTGSDSDKCDIFSISNPDNIAFMTGHDKLLIGEDTSKHHNNAVWVFDMTTQSLSRILTVPIKAETTGVYWFPDINGYAYITCQVQHPADSSYGHNGTVGYIGPIDNNAPKCASQASETQKTTQGPAITNNGGVEDSSAFRSVHLVLPGFLFTILSYSLREQA